MVIVRYFPVGVIGHIATLHTKAVMDKLGLTTGVEGKRVVVQGLGNVGYHSAKFFQDAGAKVVGLAEYEGAIWSDAGIDIMQFLITEKLLVQY